MNTQPTPAKEDLHTGQSIRTFKGHYLNVFDPKPECIDIEDIAHALSHTCRFGGHTRYFYSVAQHSFRVAQMCSMENRLTALLHDATEAYMCDLPRPIKRNLPEYKKAEDCLMKVIADVFSIPFPFPDEIKLYDRVALEMEHKELMLGEGFPRVMAPGEAKETFLNAYSILKICQA